MLDSEVLDNWKTCAQYFKLLKAYAEDVRYNTCITQIFSYMYMYCCSCDTFFIVHVTCINNDIPVHVALFFNVIVYITCINN